MSPAGAGGYGRFTSRLPAGTELVIALHPQPGTVRADGDSWLDRRWKDLDGVECILEARARLLQYLPEAVKKECDYDVKEMGEALIQGLQDMLSFLAKTTLVGAVIGGIAGAFAGGVGAVPGALIGGELGFNVGLLWLTIMGLKDLVVYVADKLGEVNVLVQEGIGAAWAVRGKADPERAAGIDAAARLFAKAEAVMLRLLLEACVMYLLAKGGGKLVGKLRSSKLGKGFADWVEKNQQRMVDNPKINPQKRMSAKSGGGAVASEPATTSPSREPAAAKDRPSSESMPAPKTPNPEAQKIANGHAYDKHVVTQKEFPEIKDKQQFAQHIDNVMENPSATKNLSGGRKAYWDDKSQTVVITNPNAVDGGTAFKPKDGKAYFDNLK